jgi:FG-GAP repeat
MRRIVVLLVLGLVVGLWPAASVVAHGSTVTQAAPANSLQADFNNDGANDLAVGVPLDNVGAIVGAGAVNVLYGSATGLSGTGGQLFSQDTPGVPGNAEVDDGFGFALASGDFNGDTFADLAVGAPGEGVGTAPAAGAVNVLYGSATGLSGTGGQLFTQVGGAVEAGDEFGAVLAAGDFNSDTFADLAAAAPREGLQSNNQHGAFSVLPGSATGLTATGGQLFTQGTPGVPGNFEVGDEFGSALASGDFNGDTFADVAAGTPFEEVVGEVAAGTVTVLYGSATGLSGTGSQVFTQVGGAVEVGDEFGAALAAGDFNGDTFADVAAGAPFEDVGSSPEAGAVSVLPGSAGGLTAVGGQLFTQVGGAVEPIDGFGFALAAGDFNGDTFADLAAGAPFERVGSTPDAGAVSVLPGSAGGLTAVGGQLFTPVGAVEAGDVFGFALAAGDFNGDTFADLAAGAPFENVGTTPDAGAVGVLPGSAGGLTAVGSQLFTQDSPGVPGSAQELDIFGFTLATGDPGPEPAPAAASGASGPSSRTRRTAPVR